MSFAYHSWGLMIFFTYYFVWVFNIFGDIYLFKKFLLQMFFYFLVGKQDKIRLWSQTDLHVNDDFTTS